MKRFIFLLISGHSKWSRCWMGFHKWDYPGGRENRLVAFIQEIAKDKKIVWTKDQRAKLKEWKII